MKAVKDKNAKTVVINEGRFIRFVRKGEWEYVERNNCSGIVIIVALTDEKKVLFTEQYRPPVDKNVIEFPAGLVNDQDFKSTESLEDAACRELFEETGYKAEKIVKLLQGPVSGGSSADLVTMVQALNIKKCGQGGGDHTEEIKVHEVSLEMADSWLKRQEKSGCLIEPKIYVGLYFLGRHNLRNSFSKDV